MKLPANCQLPTPPTVNSYVPLPPKGLVMVIIPSSAPKQVTMVVEMVPLRIAGWVITNALFRTITQPGLAASLICTL